ncbi:MFS transporter [Rothia sp. P7181]|uniref:MFS transporter n=1 Tax=unclassified Rothia (in: high G+C Gram-positive bacteria) TaxID=2689056 RepID=UPI003AD6F3CA
MFNYRLWFIGAFLSNIGTWMQHTAQDWLIFNELSNNDSTRLGIVMSLQFGPQLFLAPYAGVLADRLDRRKLLYTTQSAMGILSLILGFLVMSGHIQIWHVYALALVAGIIVSLEVPARQTFVSELVHDNDLPNAVALNSTSFNSARLIGPACAGILVVLLGTGPVFFINAATFLIMLAAISLIRTRELRPTPRADRSTGRIRDGVAYVRKRPDILAVMVAVFLVGTFGLNSAMNIAAMATTEFDKGAGEFGFLNSTMAIGSVIGTLLAARRERPRLRFIFGASAAFGLSALCAALSPNLLFFSITLIPMGLCALTIITSANAYVQVTTEPQMRGRVMSLYIAVFLGGTPVGAPLVGLVNDHWGARWGLGIAALSGILAGLIGLLWYYRSEKLKLVFDRSRKTKFVFKRTEEEPLDPVTTALEIQQPR